MNRLWHNQLLGKVAQFPPCSFMQIQTYSMYLCVWLPCVPAAFDPNWWSVFKLISFASVTHYILCLESHLKPSRNIHLLSSEACGSFIPPVKPTYVVNVHPDGHLSGLKADDQRHDQHVGALSCVCSIWGPAQPTWHQPAWRMLLSRTHRKYFHCDAEDATLISCIQPVPRSLLFYLPFFLPFSQTVCRENTLHICQGPFFPLLSSSWLAVDSMSPRIFAEDSFHIMEKSGCCLLSFPIIPWSSCFSHLL